MILSYKHNFLFIKASKVGGTSMELALSNLCGDEDIITKIGNDEGLRQGRGEQNYDMSPYAPFSKEVAEQLTFTKKTSLPKRFWGHMHSSLILAIIGKEKWDKLLKWTIVRNPFDEAISRFAWQKRKEAKEPAIELFREWIMTAGATSNRFYFFMGEKTPKKNPDGSYQKALDFYVRYEHFEEDLTELSKRLNLPENIWDSFKNVKTKNKFRPPSLTVQECFKGFPEGIAHVEEFAAPILTTFGYESPKA